MDEDNAMAFELAGEPCPRALQTSQAALEKVREHNATYAAAPVGAQTAQRAAPSAVGPGQE
jgi:hypothetical protein